MKFYNRLQEIEQLHLLSTQAYHGQSTFSLMVGRRRIGKTALIKETFKSDPNFMYFFISRKSEALLCEEFLEIIKTKLQITVLGKVDKLLTLIEFILQQTKHIPLTIVFDEFQDLEHIDASLFSGIQNIWDTYKQQNRIHFIVCGSVYSIMCKLFENNKQPLFGRADTKITVKPLKIPYLQQILTDAKQYSNQNLLTVYTIVGGVPRYLELLSRQNSWDLENILDVMLNNNSFFVNEGKDVLIEELGKDYKTYFSILSLIASGKTSRSAIESVLQHSIGGFLDNLENEFSIIKKHKPVFAKENSRTQKYSICDNFLNFWFRYIHKHQSAIEIGNFHYIIDIIKQDFKTYSGKFLESMIREQLADSGKYNIIGSYWEKNNSNELDVVACNERHKQLLIAEVKLQAAKINLGLLQHKSKFLIDQYQDYEIKFQGFSLDDLAIIN